MYRMVADCDQPITTLNEGLGENDNPKNGATVRLLAKGWGTKAQVFFVGKNTPYLKRLSFAFLTVGCISLVAFWSAKTTKLLPNFMVLMRF